MTTKTRKPARQTESRDQITRSIKAFAATMSEAPAERPTPTAPIFDLDPKTAALWKMIRAL